jgi:hypothetical protein
LTHSGTEYTNAETSNPSDSDPGGTALMTGGNPRSTGVYYDVEYSHKVDEAGAACTPDQPATGGDVIYDSPDDALASVPDFVDPSNGTFPSFDENGSIYAGGLDTDPGAIMNLTNNASSFNPATFPVDPATCKPITPWDYLGDNTIFQVIHSAGLRTAWSDKHPTYEILNGPSGTGVQDLFAPDINSDAPTLGSGHDWTSDNLLTQQYDSYKVQAVINEIRGLDHSGTTTVGTPALFGMNFQTVSTAQKLPTSQGLPGGYLADGVTPGPVLMRALDYINTQVGAMTSALEQQHLDKSTTIVLSAKHGQSPQTPSALTRIPDGPIVAGIDAAWAALHPGNPALVNLSVDDDGMLLWLNDHSDAATGFVKNYLLTHSGTGNDVNGNPKPYTQSGLASVFAGRDAAAYFGVAPGDARVPDIFGISQYGTVYTGGKAKIAEHGGANPQDRNVLLVVSGGPVKHGVITTAVETTQIAPTILQLLGLPANALQAVQIERTRALPTR